MFVSISTRAIPDIGARYPISTLVLPPARSSADIFEKSMMPLSCQPPSSSRERPSMLLSFTPFVITCTRSSALECAQFHDTPSEEMPFKNGVRTAIGDVGEPRMGWRSTDRSLTRTWIATRPSPPRPPRVSQLRAEAPLLFMIAWIEPPPPPPPRPLRASAAHVAVLYVEDIASPSVPPSRPLPGPPPAP